jgi:flagellar biosynthesis regulator FlaF
MADKIKAAGNTKKQDRSSWFENHVIVMSCDDDKEKENKIKEELKARIIMGQSGG